MGKQIAPWMKAIQTAEDRFTNIVKHDPQSAVVWQKESIYAVQLMRDKPRLQSCPPATIQSSIINVASVGLTLNPALGLAYLVPRDGACCLDVSYKGLIRLAENSGAIRYVRADVVRENDEFLWCGLDEKPQHKMKPFSKTRGDIIGAYCFVKTSDGDILADFMAKEEIDKVRNVSKAPNSPAWVKWYDQMAIKVLIKRAQKMWPKSARDLVSKAIEVVNEHEGLADDNEPQQHYADPQSKSEAPDSTDNGLNSAENEPIEGEFKEVSDDPPPASTQGTSAGGEGMSDSTKHIIQRKMAALQIGDEDFFKGMGIKGWDDLKQSDAAGCMDWISSQGSTE